MTTDALEPLDLGPIEARERAATDGPWYVEETRSDLTRWVTDLAGLLDISFGYVGNRTQADATFVAHAREDVHALLAEVRRLRTELDGRRDEVLAEAAAKLREMARTAPRSRRAGCLSFASGVLDGMADAARAVRPAIDRALERDHSLCGVEPCSDCR
ncbi:hypothetical protein BX265_4985 [Streptomyces sp. TLI_235]|nr:hypothetical protein [Streptomyces sp. TLI_235]PBC80149.1 hypothetical protein BX265_4985 [Streptomyces sp. TLI_235]